MIKEGRLLYEGSGRSKQLSNSTSNMDEKDRTESYFGVKVGADSSSNREAMEILDQTSEREDTTDKEGRKSAQDVYEDYAVVRRSNSVSKMTQHFKALQEKANAAEDAGSQRSGRRSSHGVQRYRERKAQGGGERFNTQPVTFEEVREAVLQNQRNAALNVTGTAAADDEPEPSKLSLAERVRLFNQKILATAETTSGIDAAHQEKLAQRRRPATRYKTQPVTSEEVEVASRVSPLSVNQQIQPLDGGKCNNTCKIILQYIFLSSITVSGGRTCCSFKV